MVANKLIQQPDILNLDSLGAFMDAQNDSIGGEAENKTEETATVTTATDSENDTVAAFGAL